MKTYIKKIIGIGMMAFIFLPAVVSAQTAVPAGQSEFNTSATAETPQPYVLLAPLPCVGTGNGTTCTSSNGGSEVTSINIQGYLLYVFKLLIALTVFLAVIMIIFGGFKYMTTEAVSGKGSAKKTIEDAVYGLLLALASYLILYTINPNLVDLSKVLVPKLNVAASSTTQNNIGDLNSYANQTAISSDAALTANNNAAVQAQSNLQVAQNNATQLQDEINACDTGAVACDPTTYADLQNQLSSDQQQETTYSSQATAQSSLAAMNTEIVQSSRLVDIANTDAGVESPADAATAIASNLTTLQNNYNSSLATITANGNNDPTDVQMLSTQFQYASSTLTDEQALLEAQANPSTATAALQTIAAEDAVMAQNSSTTLQQQYIAQSSSTKATLQNIQTNYQTNLYNSQIYFP